MEIAWNKVIRSSCVFLCAGDILLARDRECYMWIERYVFFCGDFNDTPPQRRSSTHSLSQTHTHTHTLTHMTGQQWLIGQVVPDFRVLQIIFDPKRVSKNFF